MHAFIELVNPIILYAALTVVATVISLAYIGLYGIVFIGLERFFPNNPDQPVIRQGMTTDFIYSASLTLYAPLSVYIVSRLQTYIYPANDVVSLQKDGLPPLSDLPLWVQIVLLFFVVDFVQYWVHRLFHKIPLLWRFHAIHHSSKTLDWLSTQRWHPLNHIVYTMLIVDFMYVFGFSPKAMGLYLTLYGLNAMLVHANLKWTYGPFRYIFASPVFHRWHHTSPEEGGNKNYAPYFSFLDVIFNTFYMPKDLQPKNFGIQNPIPDDFLGQLIHPFRKHSK